jgi:hypothetical protein
MLSQTPSTNPLRNLWGVGALLLTIIVFSLVGLGLSQLMGKILYGLTPKTIQPEPGGPAGQLYNLRDDLAETNNLYLKHPEIVAKLEAEMKHIMHAERSR